jgi:hypothetical protein
MPGVPIYLRPRPARGVISLLLQRRDRDHDGLCRPRAWHLETLPDGSIWKRFQTAHKLSALSSTSTTLHEVGIHLQIRYWKRARMAQKAEIELKLEAQKSHIRTLAGALERELKLRKHGVSLRVRRVGDHHVQTIKQHPRLPRMPFMSFGGETMGTPR